LGVHPPRRAALVRRCAVECMLANRLDQCGNTGTLVGRRLAVRSMNTIRSLARR
jgi:hypothetical protein